jgi:hypothetical protein
MRTMTGALALAAMAGGAAAQEMLTLQGGFRPDPTIRSFVAQGAQDAGALVRGCRGSVAAAPALVLRLEGAGTPLRVFARGQGLAGMVMVGPDGVYRCGVADADSVAHVRYERPLSGDYAVWPAAAVPGATVTGDALFSEFDIDLALVPGMAEGDAEGGGSFDSVAFEINAEPAYGAYVLEPDSSVDVGLTTAPRASLGALGAACLGAADPARPDVVVVLQGVEPEVHFDVEADLDATLAVVAPDGSVYCDDDTLGTDPLVSIHGAMPGDYAVWVGAWGGAEGPARLFVGREAPEAGEDGVSGLDTSAPPAWGGYVMPATPPLTVPVQLSGDAAASQFDASCGGTIDPSRPDVTLTLPGFEPLLHVAGRSAADTTLLVLGPDGRIHCNDDADGFNPGVSIAGAAPGDYHVWLGAWGGAQGSAEIVFGREAPGEDFATAMDNPFIGQRLDSAVDALDILLAEPGFGEAVSFSRVEELGREGFALHDVVLTDPSGENAPLRVARIAVTDLDLRGLSENGVMERFSLRLDGVDYAALAAAARGQDGPPLPLLQNPPPLDLFASLLPPDGDETRRAIRLELDLGPLMGLSLDATVMWEPGMTAMGPPDPEMMVAETVSVALRDGGFLGALMTSIAAEDGRPRDALIAELVEGLSFMLPQGAPGAPVTQLRDALSAKLGAIDAPGVLTARFRPAAPVVLGDAVGAVMADPSGAGLGDVEILWRPN